MGLNVQEAVIWTQPSTPSTEKGKANLPNKFKSTPDSRTHCLLRLRSDCGGKTGQKNSVASVSFLCKVPRNPTGNYDSSGHYKLHD